jgi:hypothetical protein
MQYTSQQRETEAGFAELPMWVQWTYGILGSLFVVSAIVWVGWPRVPSRQGAESALLLVLDEGKPDPLSLIESEAGHAPARGLREASRLVRVLDLELESRSTWRSTPATGRARVALVEHPETKRWVRFLWHWQYPDAHGPGEIIVEHVSLVR